jgi:hypothetical protein
MRTIEVPCLLPLLPASGSRGDEKAGADGEGGKVIEDELPAFVVDNGGTFSVEFGGDGDVDASSITAGGGWGGGGGRLSGEDIEV